MSSDSGTSSPEVKDKSNCSSNRLPRCLFLGSHQDCLGELTLDTSTLKEIWGDEPVALALASMLKAVLEGRVSSEKPNGNDDEDDKKDLDATSANNTMEARLALLEVFECFSAGMAPEARPIHVLDIDSLLHRQHELSETRKSCSVSAEKFEKEESTPDASTTPINDSPEQEEKMITAEEEMLSTVLNLVYAIRKKHKLPSPFEISSSEGDSGGDEHSLTFGIVDPDISSSCDKDDFEKEWLLVCRETKKPKKPENGIYPIQSIYSFFLVLNSDDFTQSSSQSPSSDSSGGVEDDDDDDNEQQQEEVEEEISVSVTPESDETKEVSDKGGSSPPDGSSKPSLFVAVKKHEESAWSVLAALHEEGFEVKDDDDETSARNTTGQDPDVTVIVDPLRIISEYIRYLQGEEAPPRTDQRKRRRVQVHESTVARPSCKIRILTPYEDDDDDDDDDGGDGKGVSPEGGERQSKEEYLQAKMIREQDELRKLLEQKLRELQQSIEQEEHEKTLTTTTSTSPSVESPSVSCPPAASNS